MKEASTKADKLFIMHSAKVIGKEKDDEERERQVTDLREIGLKKLFQNKEHIKTMVILMIF